MLEIPLRRFLAAVACLAVACSPMRRPSTAEAITHPRARFVDGIILLEVVLDGKPGWWILDSGFEYSVLDSATAHDAGVTVSAPVATAQPGGEVDEGRARGVTLGVAGLSFAPDSLAVIALSSLSPVVGLPLAGVLGHDFLAQHVVTIDYASHTVELRSTEEWTPPPGAIEVAVSIESGEPFVVATLWAAGRTIPAKLKLDTGSLSGLGLNGSFVQQNRVFSVDWPRRPMEGVAVGGATHNFVGRLDSMSFAGVVIPQPVVSWSTDLSRIGDAGTVGTPILSRFRLTFDYPRRRILLEPRRDARLREQWEAAGMLLVQVPDADVVVAQVLPGSPADSAGLAAGDVVRTLNAIDAPSLGLDSLRRHFRQPGRTDSIVIQRGGTPHTIILHQKELP